MIHMPRRSVTRFFIPLIDVLLLLFCIFLLMPLQTDDDLKRSQESASNLQEDVDALEAEIAALREQLLRYRLLEPKLKEIELLQERLDRLEKANKKSLQERAAVQVIDIDGKTGGLSFYDAARTKDPHVELTTEAAVADLIARQKRENPGRELYYLFLYPRPETGFPTLAQERTYQRWFAGVANSLKENMP